jgi:hypothetical protein
MLSTFSPNPAFPRSISKFRSNAARSCSTSSLSSQPKTVHFSSLCRLQLQDGLPPLQPTFTKRTNGHYLGTFIAEKFLLPPPLSVVPLATVIASAVLQLLVTNLLNFFGGKNSHKFRQLLFTKQHLSCSLFIYFANRIGYILEV